MKRLTGRFENGRAYRHRDVIPAEAIQKLAEYEDMEEQGLLVRLPCKVGDTVYDISEFVERTPCPEMYEFHDDYIGIGKSDDGRTVISIDCMDYYMDDFGRIVFTSREAAEKALEGRMKEYKDYAKITAHFDLAIEEAIKFGGDVGKHAVLLFETMRKELDSIPAADVVEVRHGRWLLERTPDGKPYCFHCSVCDDDFHHIGIMTVYDYCPNCGAYMMGESNGKCE